MEKVLICTVGLPYSGKSTWANDQGGMPIVCPDAIRLALHGERFVGRAEPFVWAIAHVMVSSLFMAGNSRVIFDATNITRKRRDEWQSRSWQTMFYVVDTPADICMERAVDANDADILPVIERMKEQLEPLENDETLYFKSDQGQGYSPGE